MTACILSPSKMGALRGRLWLILVLLTLGCASSRTNVPSLGDLPARFPDHSAEEIMAALPAYPEQMERVFAETRIALSSPEESGRFSAKISYLHPESLFVRVTFPMGIEGARVLVAPDQAWVYDRIEKVVWTGSPARVSEVLPGAVADMDLVEMAMGFEQPDPNETWSVQTDSTLYLLTNEAGSVRYTIDPSLWRVVAVREMDTSGLIVEQRWFSDFAEVERVLLPRRMALSRPPEDFRVSMALRRIEFMPEVVSFDLNPSTDAQWIDLGQ